MKPTTRYGSALLLACLCHPASAFVVGKSTGDLSASCSATLSPGSFTVGKTSTNTTDYDKDGLIQNDNCRLVHNKAQLDADGDGIGNECDNDFIAAPLDFNADGKSDQLWHKSATAPVLWLSQAAQEQDFAVTPSILAAIATEHQIEAVNDFNGDKRADILARNSNGNVVVYSMEGDRVWNKFTCVFSTARPLANWDIVATGDFDGDGAADILWRNRNTGGSNYGKLQSMAFGGTETGFITALQSPVTVMDSGSASVALEFSNPRDVNQDGTQDLLVRNTTTGSNSFWLMGSGKIQVLQGLPTLPDTSWHIAGIGDFTPDIPGTDLFFRNTGTGAMNAWIMAGNSIYRYDGTMDAASAGYSGNATDDGVLALPADLQCASTEQPGRAQYYFDGVADHNGDQLADMAFRAPGFWGADAHLYFLPLGLGQPADVDGAVAEATGVGLLRDPAGNQLYAGDAPWQAVRENGKTINNPCSGY